MKLVIFCIFSLLLSLNAFSQSHSKYEIIQDKKGKFSLVDKRNGNIANEYKGCDLIDSIHSLKYPTNPEYKDYLIIQKGKTFFVYNTSTEKEIRNIELKSKFSISIYEVRPEVNELEYNRLNQNTVSNYINILIEGESATVSLLFNFNSRKFISAKQSYRATFYYLIKENLILGQSLEESFVVDDKGKKIVPSKINNWFHQFNGGFAFKNDNYKYGVVNYLGDTIAPFIYENVEAYPKNDFVILENSDKKAGVINKQGKIVVPFVYKPKHPNYYRSYSYTNYGVFMLYKTSYSDSNFVFVDTNGVELIKEANYQNAWELWTPYESSYNKRYYFVENGKVGVYDTKQKKEIIQCKYSFFKELDDTKFGVISANDEKGNWGLLSLESGSTIIPFEYESIKSKFIFTNDSVATFIISKQGKFGIINYKGNTQLSCEYSNITKTTYDNFLIVEKDGAYGLFDIRTSNFVVPIELKAIDKNLRIEKMENGKLLKGKYDVKENHIKWEE
ncbi:MAG: WG repeat-containing protein [Vicingaceae bacterium]|nr:WG repeat-containing protein [Vicingaceae bacterium]